MRPPGRPRFLARGPYRRRRVADAARALPFAAAFLFFLPVVWVPSGAPGAGTARGAVHLFLCWSAAILAAFVFARRLGSGGDPVSDSGSDSDGTARATGGTEDTGGAGMARGGGI